MTPEYSWDGADIGSLEVWRINNSSVESIVWKVSQGGDDDIRPLTSPVVHGVPPTDARESVRAEPVLIAGVFYEVRISVGGFFSERRAAFLQSLREVLPPQLEQVFLCNSGTEAIEAALKFAFLATGRSGVVALERGFHGRTMGALGLTWNPRFRKPFAPLLQPATFVAPGDLDALDSALNQDVGLLVVEIVQGESGVHPIDDGYLQAAQALCRQRGALFLVDEIQTGIGRTGTWWAHQQADLEPDMMALAKAIAGGFPMGALASSGAVAQALRPGLHGSTFGGAPLACSAGHATLRTMSEERLTEAAAAKGYYLLERLRDTLRGVDLVREVRGRGLMVGIELRRRVAPFLTRLMNEHSILALPAGPTVLRLLPALVVTEEQLDSGIEAIHSVLADA